MADFLERISQYSPKRLALLADELNERVAALEAARHAPIAIVGIGCRFPGGADTPARYWQLLRDGVDAVSEVPHERWDVDALYDPDPDAPGRMSTRWGGWVGAVDGFDAHFFGISPREAQGMDPQQRLVLETAWRALEDAGVAPPRLEGSRTAVYLGLSAGDYLQLMRAAGVESFDAYTASGVAHSIASGRLSYVLGLRGPSVSIDTACSSSMVAIHHAVQSLRRGECDLALAGGVNLVLGPEITIALSKAHMMAPDGRCKAFDARADGFVRGEGCGMLVLKRLDDAQAAGDRIVALIRGAAANQDGRSNGLTAPNGPAQEAVLRDALADARCAPHDIDYVETHGTGTALGDPIEVNALQAVLGQGRAPGAPLRVGSVKAAIGHLEASAGVAGVIKVALMLQERALPGQLHLTQFNPYIAWDEMAIEVPRSLQPWPARDGVPRLAGVSSFGFSGTNVHLVLEEAPPSRPAAVDDDALARAAAACDEREAHVVLVSARHEAALRTLCGDLAEAVAAEPAALADVAHTLAAGRAHFAQRAAFAARDRAGAAATLAALARGERPDGVAFGSAGAQAPRVGWLFTGQGSQYAGMGAGLYRSEPVFRAALDRCAALLEGKLARPLLELLHPADGATTAIDDTAVTQPALFALEYALAQLWLAWGVRPAQVMGHSVGEYVAACVAGVFSLEDGLRLIEARGRLMGALPRGGAMAAVMAPQARVAELLLDWRGEVGIAAVNGPQNIVVSGTGAAVDAALARCAAAGLKTTRLNVSHAFHSPLMQPMLDEFTRVAEQVRYRRPDIDLVSNVSGEVIGARVAGAAYWRDHVLAPVQFAGAVRQMAEAGVRVFQELGPHPTLLGMARETVADEAALWVPSLRRGRDDGTQLREALATLYAAGVELDGAGLDGGRPRARVVLPGYPFQRERCWAPPADAVMRSLRAPGAAEPVTDLPGREIAQALSDDRLFELTPSLAAWPWLADHRIQGALLLPSPVLATMALAAGALAEDGAAVALDDLAMHQPVALDETGATPLQLVLGTPRQGRRAWRIAGRDAEGGGWIVHASGGVARAAAAAPGTVDLAAWRSGPDAPAEPVDLDAYYGWLGELGLAFGPRFRASTAAWRREGSVVARIERPAALAGGDLGAALHPARLDACLHLIGAALPNLGRGLGDAFLLMGIGRLEALAPLGERCWCRIDVQPADRDALGSRETFRADLQLVDDTGRLGLRATGLRLKRARLGALAPQRLNERVRAMLHEVAWREAPALGGGLSRVDAIAPGLLAQLPALAAQHGLARYAGFVPALDALAAAYVVRALRQLGFAFVPGERLEAEALRQRLGVLERHRRLFARMLAILAEDGVLRADGSGACHVVVDPPTVDLDARYRDTLAAHADGAAELGLTRRCADGLAEVLRGRADPLALLFPEGSLAETERLYQDSPPARTYNALIGAALDAMLATWPAGRPLRVLEIGGGTGSTTSYLLPRLAQLVAGSVDYCFTDVSPLFLQRVRDKFPQAGFLRTALLDIGRDPAAQGHAPGSFDIVVGANVLHATPDLAVTLAQVRALLAPGGRLVLLEGATPQRFGDLTVGLLEGWWCYTDTARRDYALMPREAWLALFTQVGFAQARALPDVTDDPVLRQQAVYVAEAATAPVASTRPWRVLPDTHGLAVALVKALRKRGAAAEIVDAQTALSGPAAAAGLVHLAALDVALGDDTPPEALMAGQQALIGGALALVQQAVRAGDAPPLWFVTRGAQAVRAGEGAEAAQATLWGLSHNVALEHPELACRRVDLDPALDPAAQADALADELLSAGAEDQLAHRQGRRWVRRLVRRAPRPASATTVAAAIDASRSYLVTGGLRGLGLRVAQWMVERGARHLALLGRQAPDARAQVVLQQLQAAGAQVLVLQGDVAQGADLDAAFARIAAALPALAGVVHSAGVLDDGVLTAQSWPRFAMVMGPKVQGTWRLHRHLQALARPVDFFVLFASGASLAGSPGQANHAAANAFEDALAWRRQAAGLPTVSINWGPWAEIGAAAGRTIGATGLRPIAPADGLAALEHALRGAAPGAPFALAQFGVLDTDWSHLADAAAAGRLPPLYAELQGTAAAAALGAALSAAAGDAATATLRERLRAAMPNRRLALLREEVRRHTTKVLGLARADELDIHEPLRQLGLDSLMAVELRNRLGKAVERSLPATLTFDHPSVEALVVHLAATAFADEITAEGAPAAVPVAAPPPSATTMPEPPAVALDELSTDELADALASRLARLSLQEKP